MLHTDYLEGSARKQDTDAKEQHLDGKQSMLGRKMQPMLGRSRHSILLREESHHSGMSLWVIIKKAVEHHGLQSL
jgi:hypothetical protein